MVAVIEPVAGFAVARSEVLGLALEAVRKGIGVEPMWFAPGRHVVGTADDCTHVLIAGGVQPHHCEIQVEGGRASIRALDFRTWLNNGPVRQATLRAGDRLTIGPLEFQVSYRSGRSTAVTTKIAAPAAPVTCAPPSAAVVPDTLRVIQERQAEMEARLTARERTLSQRAAELESQGESLTS